MRVTKVRGLHAAENGGTPAVEFVVATPRTRGARTLEVSLHQVVHSAEERAVLITVKARVRDADGFSAGSTGESVVQRVSLAQLRTRSLKGYRIVVFDDAGDTLAEGAWR